MKIEITKAHGDGRYTDDSAIGEVHLVGPIDTTACGLADEMYDSKPTNKRVTCSTCKTHLSWAKKVAKIKS